MKSIFDIETAPRRSSFDKLDDREQELWRKKSAKKFPDFSPEESYSSAGLFPEFGRIVCVTIGVVHKGKFRMKSFVGTSERKILEGVAESFSKMEELIGHNIKGFDIPYLCKRFLKHNIPIPDIINTMGKKPWESKHLKDTMEMWKFGGWDNVSLDLVCYHLGIPSPKSEMDGSKVGEAFFAGKVGEIATYCSMDVKSNAHVYYKMIGRVFPVDDIHQIVPCKE